MRRISVLFFFPTSFAVSPLHSHTLPMLRLVSIECAYPNPGSGTLTAPVVSLLTHQRCVSSVQLAQRGAGNDSRLG
jgi:hypothetical protein